jgi:hypothetical protein
MDNIQQHIEKDKKILDDPTISPQMRRHTEEELCDLEAYAERHPGESHDPTSLELFCDNNPDAPECKVYED